MGQLCASSHPRLCHHRDRQGPGCLRTTVSTAFWCGPPPLPMGRLPSRELGLPGQGECVGSLKEQTHGLRDVQAVPGGGLAVGSQSQVCPGSLEQDGLCRLWGKDSVPLTRHKQRKPVPGGAREQRLTAECLAGTNPVLWQLLISLLVVPATWGMPGEWGWGEPFLGGLLGLAWRCGRMLGPGDLGQASCPASASLSSVPGCSGPLVTPSRFVTQLGGPGPGVRISEISHFLPVPTTARKNCRRAI